MSGYTYKTEVHALHGMNKHGGFGGPLCAEPYGDEVQSIVKRLLADSENDKTLAFNNFTDPCPELTKKQLQTMKGFDYADKKKKLPFGPLPWPTGLPAPGYVPKTNPLNGRWVTVTGGDAEFIKKSIASGMLGSAEASKIQADVDTKKTGGMFLRITQNGEVCTVDASVAKFARAVRTWKSGHYFYEPLVSGSHLFGVWVLPEEYRKIGFFWEMTSGKCFRIQRNAWLDSGYMFMRQSTEAFGRISHIFYVKVDSDPEVDSRPALQSRDFTALAGVFNAPDNLGNPYPCQPVDLDAPVERDTWMDQNKEVVAQQAAAIGKSVQDLEKETQQQVNLGWTSDTVNVHVDALWEALNMKARSPEKFMDVSDVIVSDADGYLSRSMTIKANNKIMKERIWINRVASEIVFQPLHPDTGAPLHEERVIAVREEPNLHLEFYQRDVTDGMRSPWKLPVDVVSKSFQEVVKVAQKLENTVQPVIGLGFHSSSLEDVNHDALWLALLNEVRQPRAHAPNCSVIDCDGYIERKLSSTGSTQHVYVREEEWEVVYRDVIDGKESQTECAIVLRGHPVEIEICERNVLSGFRVHSSIPKSEASVLIDLTIKSAKKLVVEPPATVGLGLCSAAIHDVSYDSLFTALELSALKPWLIRPTKESDCTVTDCGSHVKRVLTRSDGKVEKDIVTINEENGEVSFVEEGHDVERVTVILKNPYRYEIYQRNISDKMRVAFGVRSVVAKDTMSAMVKLAREIEKSASDVVGYGMVSHPMTSSRDKLWRAMLSFLSRPAECGMPVDSVSFQEKAGYMVRSMRLIPTNKVSTDNIRVNEAAQEITFRSVKGEVEGTEERVLSLRTEPLRCEIHCREVSTEMRVNWKAPRATVGQIFDAIDKAAANMN
jgi:hypothetical protein